jgi:Fe(II)/alpha-ketoglutarate-dependent arginine beta-hydroxylase
MNRLTLSDAEIKSIKQLVCALTSQYDSVEAPSFLKDISVYAHEIPRRVRVFLNDFKLLEPRPGLCLISGYPIDEESIGPTPQHWQDRTTPSMTLEEEMALVLFGALLGDALAWATQQNGYIVHDVLPIKAYEQSQMGTGSEQTLWWHNEDAFHSLRGDYIGLFCLRNPDQVCTTFASVDMLELNEEQRNILSQQRFFIRPDDSHAIENKTDWESANGDGERIQDAYKKIQQMNTQPAELAVLFGDLGSPYIRIDPYFMDTRQDDVYAERALNTIIKQIDERLTDVVLKPGDFLFIDNYRAVHGRKPFKARYDGRDRWLKRINVTRDLRKSRYARKDAASRVIFSN